MTSVLEKAVDPVLAIQIIIIIILLAYFIYKEWPEFRKRITTGAVEKQKEKIEDETFEKRLAALEEDDKEINQKLNRDYSRLNRIEVQLDKARAAQAEEMEELEIIMRALLVLLKSLQETGASAATKEAEAEIQAYLNRKAHRNNPNDRIITETE